jgi:drug/metabolite transporter (DMT)-like permease
MVGGALFFQAWVALGPAPKPRLDGRTHAKLFGLATLGITLNQALALWGLRWSTPFTVGILGATIPVLAAALSVIFGKERASVRTALGLVLSISGVLWLTGVGSFGPHAASTSVDKGAIIVAINGVCYAAYVVFAREVVVEVGSIRAMAWFFTYGGLLFLPLGVGSLVETVPVLSTRGWLFIAYIVLVPTVVAYGLHAWALARSSATVVAVYIYLQPLLTGLLARIQLGYAISPRAAGAGLLILGGVAVTTLRKDKTKTPAARTQRTSSS